MSAIGGGGNLRAQGQAVQTPWDDRAASEVRGLRRAITEQMSDKKVASDLAPMMSELLARLDSFVAGEPRADLAPPAPANLAEPPSLREAASALTRAGGKIRQLARGGANPQQRASLQNMAQVLDRQLAMRHEVIMRAQVP